MATSRFSALRSFLNGGAPAEEEDTDAGNAAADEQPDDGGQGDDEQDGSDAAGEEGEDGPEEGEAKSGNASARKATLAERRRWAQVLTHANAEGRLEAATGLLVEDLSASAITRILGGLPTDGRSAMASRLATTPKHNLGSNPPQGEGKSGDRAAESRRRATQQANAGLNKQKTTSGKQRVAGAKA